MANAACDELGEKLADGIVITQYGHVKAPIGSLQLFEAEHPVPDQDSFDVTRAAIDYVRPFVENGTVLFLLSGDGSVLFECPLVP